MSFNKIVNIMKVRSICLTEEQDEFIKNECVNLSAFIQKTIEKKMQEKQTI